MQVIRVFLDAGLTRYHQLVGVGSMRHGTETFVHLFYVVVVPRDGRRRCEATAATPTGRSGRRSPAAGMQRRVAPGDARFWVYVATRGGAVRVNWPAAAAAVRRWVGATGAEQLREGCAEFGAERAVEDEVGRTVDHHKQVKHVTSDPHHLRPNTPHHYHRVLSLFI